MLDPLDGASFDPENEARFHCAFDRALEMLSRGRALDDGVSRKLVSALIRYARTDEQREPEEIARLAVMHVLIASAPMKS